MPFAGFSAGVISGLGVNLPLPTITAKPTITGTPQVGQTLTGNSGTYQNGSVASRAWLLNGSAISGATGTTYVAQAAGSLVYREVVTGAGGSINADSDPVTVAPAITPMPSGLVELWDGTTVPSGTADGAGVPTWTGTNGTAAPLVSGGNPTFVANSGGLPAVRIANSVLMASGSNPAQQAFASGEWTMVVIARAIKDSGGNPCIASIVSGGDTTRLFQANTTSTGFYQRMTSCADAGMRSIGLSVSSSKNAGGSAYCMDGINGTALMSGYAAPGDGQVCIGGWKDTGNSGQADIIAIAVFNRALTATEFKQVHRRYCDKLGQAYPGGSTARIVSVLGNSIPFGQGVNIRAEAWPYLIAKNLGLPWGTWDNLSRAGFKFSDIQSTEVPSLGSVSALTNMRSIVVLTEGTNDLRSGSGGAASVNNAKACMTAVLNQDPNREIIFATQPDDGSSVGVSVRQARSDYNAYWDTAANRTGIAAYAQTHLDTNIGVQGSAPTNGTANTYFQADDIHPTAAGQALIANGPYGIQAQVQARLAAA